MEETEFSIILMITGAMLGAVWAPATELFANTVFGAEREKNRLRNGLAFLASANGIWVIAFWLFGATTWPALVLYVVSAALFMSAFQQFRKMDASERRRIPSRFLALVAFGNLLWVLGESSELALRFFSNDDFPFLYVKYGLNAAAAVAFCLACFFAYRSEMEVA